MCTTRRSRPTCSTPSPPAPPPSTTTPVSPARPPARAPPGPAPHLPSSPASSLSRCFRADSRRRRRRPLPRRLKLMYYQLFSWAYGFVGRRASLVMVNSSWTGNHIRQLWGQTPVKVMAEGAAPSPRPCGGMVWADRHTERRCCSKVYPPCNTMEFQALPLDGPPGVGRKPIVSAHPNCRAENPTATATLTLSLASPAPRSSRSRSFGRRRRMRFSCKHCRRFSSSFPIYAGPSSSCLLGPFGMSPTRAGWTSSRSWRPSLGLPTRSASRSTSASHVSCRQTVIVCRHRCGTWCTRAAEFGPGGGGQSQG